MSQWSWICFALSLLTLFSAVASGDFLHGDLCLPETTFTSSIRDGIEAFYKLIDRDATSVRIVDRCFQ